MNTKPKIKYEGGRWLCGGLFTPPWYIDWFSGDTPMQAFYNWKKATGWQEGTK